MNKILVNGDLILCLQNNQDLPRGERRHDYRLLNWLIFMQVGVCPVRPANSKPSGNTKDLHLFICNTILSILKGKTGSFRV